MPGVADDMTVENLELHWRGPVRYPRPIPGTYRTPRVASVPAYTKSRKEILRLKAKGLGTTQIAALLRLPYRDVAAAN